MPCSCERSCQIIELFKFIGAKEAMKRKKRKPKMWLRNKTKIAREQRIKIFSNGVSTGWSTHVCVRVCVSVDNFINSNFIVVVNSVGKSMRTLRSVAHYYCQYIQIYLSCSLHANVCMRVGWCVRASVPVSVGIWL